MRTLSLAVLAGSAALFAGAAQAAPISAAQLSVEGNAEQVRLVCDQYGNCYRSRGQRRVIVAPGYTNSYNYYQPSYGYGGPYGHRHYRSAPGVSFNAPGVSVGVGFGGSRW